MANRVTRRISSQYMQTPQLWKRRNSPHAWSWAGGRVRFAKWTAALWPNHFLSPYKNTLASCEGVPCRKVTHFTRGEGYTIVIHLRTPLRANI